jgi:hypothetical protein
MAANGDVMCVASQPIARRRRAAGCVSGRSRVSYGAVIINGTRDYAQPAAANAETYNRSAGLRTPSAPRFNRWV